MLRTRLAAAFVLGLALCIALPPAPIVAADDGICVRIDPVTGKCTLRVGVPPGGVGGGGGGGGGGGSSGDPCGYTMVSPQPPASDPIWGGLDPAKADVYEKVCPGKPPELVVLGAGIGALPPPMDPAVLAQQIIASLTLLAPPIQTMPAEGSEGAIVGVPVWLWVERGPTTTGPQIASDAQGGVSVTVTAQVTEVTWELGDGTSLSCGIGTPYDGTVGPSPTCGHVYEVKSTKTDPNGAYTISATSTWSIAWAGGGETGFETMQFTSTSQMRVTEINVLVVPGG